MPILCNLGRSAAAGLERLRSFCGFCALFDHKWANGFLAERVVSFSVRLAYSADEFLECGETEVYHRQPERIVHE